MSVYTFTHFLAHISRIKHLLNIYVEEQRQCQYGFRNQILLTEDVYKKQNKLGSSSGKLYIYVCVHIYAYINVYTFKNFNELVVK